MFTEFLSQNLLWVGAFVVVANLLVYSFLQSNVKGVGTVSALEFPQLQRSGNTVIVDINDHATFAASHIPDARNIPLADINEQNTELNQLKDKTVVLVCQSGTRSAKAARSLQSLGFTDVHILRGGMMNWTKENLPVVSAES